MLETKVIERAAQIIFQSYNTVTTKDAFYMAIGEAEVEFDTDIDMKFNSKVENQINKKVKK